MRENSGGADALYLDLIKKCLLRLDSSEELHPVHPALLGPFLAKMNLTLVKRTKINRKLRSAGKDWPTDAETMIGLPRLDNLESCIRTIVADDVPGDLIETGVWRGGACIFMRAALAALGDESRTVWVADSFEGLPPPDQAHPVDKGDLQSSLGELGISQEEVQENFRRYGLLDHRVRFLKGWFADTLPRAPIESLSLLRLDGDMCRSTIDALETLYPKLSPGGFLIVDDYALRGAKEAVNDFRRDHDITEPIEEIDWTGVFWRRSR